MRPGTHGSIYDGAVVHRRVRPVDHRLEYRVFALALDVERLEETAAGLKLFSIDRFNLFCLRQRDHGHRDGRTIAAFAREQVAAYGMEGEVARIVMLAYPRILGYAFNPITVYWCLGADERPRLMIYEVRNTFGEHLTYVLRAGEEHDGTWTHATPKRFGVSPFNDVSGDYSFHVTKPGETMTMGVALRDAGGALIRTHFRAAREPLSDRSLWRMFVAHPMMTAKVVAGIHVEAAKLWRKGLRMAQWTPTPKEPVVRG